MIEHLNDEQLNALTDRIRSRTQVEGESDAARQHLEACSECRDRFGRLAKLLSVAEAMPRRVEPPADLWPSIRASILERGPERTVVADVRGARPPWHARRSIRFSLAAAAALIVAILYGTQAGDRITADSRASATTPNSTSANVSASAITTPDNEQLRVEQELLAALELRRSALRPSTSAQIDSSLRVINGAIAELEAARARDPDNMAIRQMLAVSRARKLELLKQAQNAS